MENYQVAPQLGFAEAVTKALGRLTDFKGRSRRSEFWWWMLVVIIVNYLSGYAVGGNVLLSLCMSIVIMAFGLAVTVRRLHDTGRNGIWVYLSFGLGIVTQLYLLMGRMGELFDEYNELILRGKPSQEDLEELVEVYASELTTFFLLGLAWMVSSLIVVVMCCLDGKPENNKYGESPKYRL